MSKIEQIEAELQKLSPAELMEIQARLDDFLEDQLTFIAEFEAQVRQSEAEMTSNLRPRIRATPSPAA